MTSLFDIQVVLQVEPIACFVPNSCPIFVL